MKALKTIGVILGILLAVLLVLVFIAPSEMRVEKSIKIQAPSDVVFPEISSFSKMNEWSPWMKLDPTMEQSIEGQDGTVGATHKWSGNDKVGVGQQKIIAIDENKGIKTKLNFMEPWESEADAFIELASMEDETEVTWGFVSPLPKPMNVMALFMDMEEAVGKDYQKGLNSLKTIVEEKASKQIMGYTIEEVEMPERNFISLRNKEVAFEDIANYLGESYGKIMEVAGKLGLEMDGRPSGLYYHLDDDMTKMDMAAAFPISSKVPEGTDLAGTSLATIPAGKALLINYYGSYDDSGKAHEALGQYLERKNLTAQVPCWEEYVTDPGEEPNPAKWLTRIYYFLENE